MHEDGLRGVSRAAYGNSYMLEVGCAIAGHPEVTFIQRDLVQATGVEKGLVATVIRRLEDGGLIERLGEDGREHPFVRSESIFWNNLVRHRAEIVDLGSHEVR